MPIGAAITCLALAVSQGACAPIFVIDSRACQIGGLFLAANHQVLRMGSTGAAQDCCHHVAGTQGAKGCDAGLKKQWMN
jgi:hypothetical protein